MKDGWDIKKLGEVCFITMGQSPNSESYNKLGDGLPFFQGCSDFGAIHPLVTTWCNQPNKIANPNDILMSVRAPIGTLNIADSKCCIGRGLAAFTQKEGVTINKFLYYFLLSSKGDLQSKGTGATFKAIGKELIKNYAIKLPSLTEQQHIVEELDLLSSIIEKKKAQLNELDNLAQSLFYEMFNEEFAIKQNWRKCHVGDVYKFQYGKGNKIPEDKGNYLCYGSNGVVGHHTTFNSEDAPIIGHIGAYAGIVNWGIGKHYVTYNGVICKLKEDCNNPIYGYYMLKSQDYLNIAKRGGAQPFVSYDLLEEPTIYVPPLDLQNQFASKIDIIDKQKELLKQSIKEVEALFNSRMDYYFN